MRKRTIIIAIAVLELAAIPAFAFIGLPSFDLDRTHIISAEIESPQGIKQFFVSSDSPFNIVADQVEGRIETVVTIEGQIGDAVFGGNTQLPGKPRHCVKTSSAESEIIYTANTGTIADNGPAISQAVLVTILHDEAFNPGIEFLSPRDSNSFLHAETCR